MAARILPTVANVTRAQTPSVSRRAYATAAGSSSSSTPLVAGLVALAGAGAAFYFYSGGSVDVKDVTRLEEKAKAAVGLEAKATATAAVVDSGSVTSALDPKAFRNFKLREIKPYNDNTSTYIFDLPEGTDSGLHVASCLVTKAADDSVVDDKGKAVVRPYTPVTAPSEKGRIDLMIKKYKGGKMTEHIHSLKPGQELAMKGPISKFEWKANQFESVGFIMGGSGLTPAWQVLQEIDQNPEDNTKATLVFSNVEEKDILLRKELDDLQKRKPDQFKIVYSLDKPPLGWKGFTGYLTADVLKQSLPPASMSDKVKLFVCGPPPQVAAIAGKKDGMKQGELKGILADLGYSQEQVFKF